MRKVVLIICSILLITIIGNIQAEAFISIVVDDSYINSNPSSACTASKDNLYFNVIQDAVNSAENIFGSTIIVCPGTYHENVEIIGNFIGLIIKGYAPPETDPAHVIAADSSKSVFLVYALSANVTIEGLKIEGAIDDRCTDATPDNNPGSDFYKPQPCAGIRVFCTQAGHIRNNEITGNHHGVIVKDSNFRHSFGYIVEKNKIYENTVGVKFNFGKDSNIIDNHIHNNATGIRLVDTWKQVVSANTIEENGIGLIIEREDYTAGLATAGNIIYHNEFKGNEVTQYSDDSPGIVNINCGTLPASCGDDKNCELKHFLCDHDICPDPDSDGIVECQHYWHSPDLTEGNRWSSFDTEPEGCYDANGDRICDVPYNDDPYPITTVKCDIDNNGTIEGNDLYAFLEAIGSNPGSPFWNPMADLDLDDRVDMDDYNQLAYLFLSNACPEQIQ